MSSFYSATEVQRIIEIVERLWLRSSNRLTVNVIRNQQRNRRTLDETNISSPQATILFNTSTRRFEAKLR